MTQSTDTFTSVLPFNTGPEPLVLTGQPFSALCAETGNKIEGIFLDFLQDETDYSDYVQAPIHILAYIRERGLPTDLTLQATKVYGLRDIAYALPPDEVTLSVFRDWYTLIQGSLGNVNNIYVEKYHVYVTRHEKKPVIQFWRELSSFKITHSVSNQLT